jgi:phosphohistidine phosphatase SixA
MRIIIVTHSETIDGAPKKLSENGRGQARDLVGRITGVMGEDFRIPKAVSSPAVRCIETALKILGELSGEKLRRLDTDPRLMAAKDPMEGDQLSRALSDYGCDGLLVSLHADLANALPSGEKIKRTKEGWFQVRPVLAIIDWEPERKWDENRIIRVLGPDGDSLVSTSGGASDTPLLK